MSLVLTVDGDRWRGHLRSFAAATPGLVPVVKGNGYGFTAGRLARRSAWLDDQGSAAGRGVDTVAVGTYDELPEVASRFAGSMLVLTPWRPGVPVLEPTLARRVIHTVSRPDDLTALLACQQHARYVLELLTSMRRHGMTAPELWSLAGGLPRAARLEGVALHLPLASTTGSGSHVAEVQRLITDVVGAALPSGTIWVSHLSGAELDRLRSTYADLTLRPRVGTDLWLGDRGALRITASVLDVHPVERGQTFGYRGRSAPRDGHLLIVSGGTAHGIGLEAPQGRGTLRARAATVARGSLDAVGLVRSPFWVDGKQRLFAEPPHMQVSMLFVPAGVRIPAVGDEVEARVRLTTTTFDRVDVT